ncbi:type IV secretory pathway TrbL component [Bradyrhizobium diazoefficiens]
MNKALITAVVLLAGVPASAAAQERAGAAAIGAVSGAVVLGPIGAVAGAVVGYTAGPAIARSWGARDSRSARHRQPPRRETYRAAATGAPPRAREAMNANGQIRAAGNPPAQAAPAEQPVESAPAQAAPVQTSTPPIQGFE